MILIDPGLSSGSAQGSVSARRPAARTRKSAPETLPSTRALAQFLRIAQAAVRLRGQVSVLLATDAKIRRLNRDFRGIDRPTDVLSFLAPASPVAAERVAGDLAISVPAAQRQAAEHGHPTLTEIKVLILHGLLHLAGYDHHADSGQMDRRERKLRVRLKLPPGLIQRAAQHPSAQKTGRRGARKQAGKPAGGTAS